MLKQVFAAHLATVFLILGSFAQAQATAEGEKLLEEKGLEKSRIYFVLEKESDVATAMREVNVTKRAVYATAKELAAVEQKQQAADLLIKRMFAARSQLRKRYEATPSIREKNKIVTQINELGDRIAILQDGKELKAAAQKARGSYNAAREGYIGKLLEVRKLADTLNDQYESLKADKDVTDAIAALAESSGEKLKLGPSSTFASNVRALKKLEDRVLSETLKLRKSDGDIYYIAVTFNGEYTEELSIDTGASVCALPWDMAGRVGMLPDTDAPTLRLQMADGRIIEAKQVIADSIRIGKFTVENVECAVFPEDIKEGAAAIGQTYLRHFSYKIDSDRNQMTMNKVETGGR